MRGNRLWRCATAAVGATNSAASPPGTNHIISKKKEEEKSFLRNVIPLAVKGPGGMANLMRHSFLNRDELIVKVLGALEHVPLPSAPRLIAAEGFQRLLEGDCPQRELRELFEEAYEESRRVLAAAMEGGKAYGGGEQDIIERIRYDPLMRLLAYELIAACDYYHNLLTVSSSPQVSCSVSLRTMLASDIRLDAMLGKMMHSFQDHPRNIHTGERLEPMPAEIEEFVKECFLLERDVFGQYRFDPRGDNHHLIHCIKIDDITKTQTSFCVALDPLVKEYGNFDLKSVPVHGGRWMQHTLRCATEDHRLLPDVLPEMETVMLDDEIVEGKRIEMNVYYDEPICLHRHKESTREGKSATGHTEVFELAIENTNKTFFERWFMDQY